MNTCDSYRDLIEAYALGALGADEQSSFEQHLATGCKDCAQKVAEARVLVSQLAYLVPPEGPPSMLKGRLMQIVRSEAQAAKPSSAALTNVVPLWFWAGVAALFFFTVLEAWDARIMREEMRTVNERATAEMQKRQELQQELTELRREQTILADPASVKIRLPGKSADLPGMEATWHSALGIIVSGQKVAPPSEGRVLQLWLIPKAAGRKPIPSLAVRPDTDGRYFLLVANPPGSMEETKALAITEEPAGGSAQPTTSPKWVGRIS